MIRLIFFLVLLPTISACNNELADKLQSGAVVSLFGLEGRWAGPVTPIAETCGQTTTGVMVVAGTTFVFDPFQGTTAINGILSDTGLQGTFSRLGNGQQKVSITFTGTPVKQDGEDETIDGRMESGRCSWTVHLKRA